MSIFSPIAFNQNATLSYDANTAYMRANAQALYQADGPGIGSGNYGAGGSWRFDNVTVTGVPAPGAIALLGVAGLLGSRRRRRGRANRGPASIDRSHGPSWGLS